MNKHYLLFESQRLNRMTHWSVPPLVQVTEESVVASTGRSNKSRRCNSSDILVLSGVLGYHMSVNDRAGYTVCRMLYKMKLWGVARDREVNLPFPQPHHPSPQQTSDPLHQGVTASEPECSVNKRILPSHPSNTL